MKYLGIILIVFIVFSGCASIEANLRQKYVGTHKNRLLGQRGFTDQKIPDGQGGEIWIYSYEKIDVSHNNIDFRLWECFCTRARHAMVKNS